MKKLVTILLSLMIICTLPVVSRTTANAATSGDFEYTVNPDGVSVTITGYTGEGGDIAIPDTLDAKTVTKININAFRYNTTLENIILSNNITYIGPQAFEKCSNLQSIILSNTLEEIGGGCFSHCSSLAEIELPASLKTIGNSAFAYSGLLNITIPENITLIETYAFACCDSLSGITVSESNPNYKSVDGILLDKTGTELLQYPNGNPAVSYTVPDGVTTIGPSAFTSSPHLEEVALPDSLTSILTSAFHGCSKLNSIEIPLNVSSIGDFAFGSCESLTSLTLPNSVTSIGRSSFANCNQISSLTISNNLSRIEEAAFSDCSSLNSITIPSSVAEIGERAFSGCNGLNNITIPSSVEEIGDGAFSSCFNLIELTVEEGNLYYKSIDGALFDYDVTNLIQYFNDPDRSNFEIPVGVTTICDGAFDHCVYLDNITIPNTVETIVDGAFERCNVQYINIPASVKSMANSTFEHCTQLQEINVDSANPYFSSIDGVLFNKAGTKLLQYTIGSENTSYTVPDGVTDIISSAFQFNILESITLPASLSNIDGNALNECTLLKDIIVDEISPYYSSDDGVLFNKAGTVIYQYPRAKQNPNYVVPNEVVSIEYHSFYKAANLKNVYIPVGVNNISSSAFSDFFYSYTGTIYGESGSYAESYANSNDITFIAGELVLVSGIELDEETLLLRPGEIATLTATVYPEDAAEKDIIWSSSDTGVASVKDGIITTYTHTGNATISAETKDGSFIDTCEVRVEPLQCTVNFYTSSYGTYGYYARPVVVDFGSAVSEPPTPFNEGYCFVGWYPTPEFDTEPISFPFVPTEAETYYYAKWEEPDSSGTFGEYDYWVKNGEATITGYNGIGGSVALPDTLDGHPVVAIGSKAFTDNTDVAQITIPSGVRTIGTEAFSNCAELEKISIPDSVDTIGWHSFMGCSSLKSIVLPQNLTLIDDATFWGCNSLSSVTIPDGVTDIENLSFVSCALESVTLPGSIAYLGGSAFAQCSNLRRAYFEGNAPLVGVPSMGIGGVPCDVFDLCAPDFTVCYQTGATGFTNPWHDYPTGEYNTSAMLESSEYSIDRTGGYIVGVSINTSAAELKNGFINNLGDLKVFDAHGIEYSGSTVATGMTVKLYAEGEVKDELTVFVLGDLSGDGKISITDYTLVRLDILSLKGLTGAYRQAGDVNGDGVISITDYTLIRLDILGLKSIH